MREFGMSRKAVRFALRLSALFGLPSVALVIMGTYLLLTPKSSDARVNDPTTGLVLAAALIAVGILLLLAAAVPMLLTRSRLELISKPFSG